MAYMAQRDAKFLSASSVQDHRHDGREDETESWVDRLSEAVGVPLAEPDGGRDRVY